MAAIEPNENNPLYKCLKESNKPLQMNQLCQWEGSVLDYGAHLKEIHPESCFVCKKNTAFYWKIPLEDCFDKGLIQHKSKYYLYEICYKKTAGTDEENVYVTLTDSRDKKQEYQLHLCEKNSINQTFSQMTNSLPSLLLPILERQCIKIPKNMLDEYCDYIRRLKFKFTFK